MSLLLALTGSGGSTAYTLACDAGAYIYVGQDAILTVTQGGAQDTHDGFWAKQWKRLREREKKQIYAELIEEIEEQIEEVKAVQVVAAATKAIAKAQYIPDFSEQTRIIEALMAHRAKLIEQEDEELLLLL